MATSSITKNFLIKNLEAYEKLMSAFESENSDKKVLSNYYEEGKEKLVQYFGPCDN